MEKAATTALPVPRWMWPAGAFLASFSVYVLFARALPLAVESSAMWARLGIEALAYFWAAARPELPSGVRRSLRILGGTTVFSGLVRGVLVAKELGVVTGFDSFIGAAGSLGYFLGLLALLVYPRATVRRAHLLLVALDVLLVAGSLAVVQGLVIRAAMAGPTHQYTWTVIYGVAQVAMIAGLSGVIDVGRPTPSRGAFRWFIAALGAYLPVTLFGQIAMIDGLDVAERLRNVSYYGGVLLTLVAALRIRRDPIAVSTESASRAWLFGLNPLTLLMPFIVGGMLLLAIVRKDAIQLLPLGIALVVVMLLFVIRLTLTAQENGRLRREERAAARRLERVRTEERARLMADMHDGFGSQLVSARIRAERGQLAQAELETLLAECMADLYLVIDSLKADDDKLVNAVADYRARLGRRLEGLPCRLRWKVSLKDAPSMPSRTILQVMRVLQEAINNALKHARANTIWIDLDYTPPGTLELSVADDGIGLTTPSPSGRGLDYMQIRAHRLDADWAISPREPGPGTVVVLRVPLGRASLTPDSVRL